MVHQEGSATRPAAAAAAAAVGGVNVRIQRNHQQRRQKKKKNRGWPLPVLFFAITLSLFGVASLYFLFVVLVDHVPQATTIRNQVHFFSFHPATNRALLLPPPPPRLKKKKASPMTSLRAIAQPQVASASASALSPGAVDTCTRTLWHTLESTTIVLPRGETFVHTGDIDDLWLRDSAAQIHPLLLPLARGRGSSGSGSDGNTGDGDNSRRVALIYDDMKLDRVVAGLIARHALYIRHDPYANAFRIDDSYVFSDEQRLLGRHDLISTWNYELDSGAYTIRMLYHYWKSARSPDAVLRAPAVRDAVAIAVDLWIAEQHHESDAYPTGPLFDCQNCDRPYRYPGLPREGKGSPTNASAGLTWTGFRPSDDACRYGYLVPANMFAYVVLGYVLELNDYYWSDLDLASRALKLRNDIQRGIEEHAIVTHPHFGKIYAYEVDGLGHHLLMDDANVPSLLSIPYLEYPYDEQIYANTRRFILSPSNPTYATGTNARTGPVAGIGSPHMQAQIRSNIWPMAMAMQALTTGNRTEAVALTEQLVQASAGTGWMHESFDPSDPSRYTRSWFCWADSLFAELVLRLQLSDDDNNKSSTSSNGCPDPKYKYKILEWRDPITISGGMFASA
jgi:uncharacterized protein